MKRLSPTVSLSVDIDITNINKSRKKSKKNITITHILVYIISKHLKDFDLLYSCFNGRKIINNPEKKSLEEISKISHSELEKIKNRAGTFKKYLEKIMKLPKIIRKIGVKLPGIELNFIRNIYGNFVITDIGTLGMNNGSLTIMKPIVSSMINGKIKENNSKEILPITLWFNHKVIDAGYASRFLNKIKKELEEG